jgi:periplasmic protein TonB
MQTNNILSAPLIDLIFDGRNKEYGAYEFRRSYAKRINKALFITTAIAALAFGGVALASAIKKKETSYKISPDVNLIDIAKEEKVEKIPEPVKPKPQEVQVKTVQLTDFKPIPDDEVQTPPPSQIEMETAAISTEKHDGIDEDRISKPGVENVDGKKGIIEDRIDKEPEIFTSVEVDAKFSGNWKAFLERNLNPNTPTDNNAPEGSYSVMIQFVVDVEGNVSDIKPLTNHGYGLEQEAVRVLEKAAKWEPAIQNGIKVKAYRKQVITFQVLGE